MSKCPTCQRPLVDPMTLNSTGYNRSMCYKDATGSDSRCKPKVNKIVVNPLRQLPPARYLLALKRIRALIAAGEPLVTADSNEIGNKYTHCSWGLCTEDKVIWPDKEDHTWPEDFVSYGRVAPLSTDECHSCPFDWRGPGKAGEFRNGCFYTCKVFRASKKHPLPNRDEALRLYDERIKAMEQELSK